MRGLTWFLFLMSGIFLILHSTYYNYISDDAFIVARYARNVVEGHGWVYNLGDRVEGYTSFLWVGLTAVLGYLGVDYVIAVRSLSLACAVACWMLLFLVAPQIGIPRQSPFRCIPPMLFAASGTIACWSLAGLEACGFALVILGVLYTVGEATKTSWTRLVLAGAASGLCVLMRAEGVMIIIAVSAMLRFARREKAWRILICYWLPIVMVIGPHLLWRHDYYGYWLPNTFYAKVAGSFDQIIRGGIYVGSFATDNGGLLAWVLPFLLVQIVHRASLVRLIALSGLLLVGSVILVGGDGLPMYRFMAPVIPLWALLVGRLIADLFRLVRTKLPQAGIPAASMVSLMTAGCLAAPLMAKPHLLHQYETYEFQRDIEVPRWTAAGRWLGQHADADASIACVPIGAVGYYSKLPLYDMMGLTDRHIAHKRISIGSGQPGHEKHDGPYILSRKPTYLLLGNIQVLDAPMDLEDPKFVKPAVPAIRQREDDIFIPQLLQEYEPRRVQLQGGLHFHFLQRRDVFGE